MDLVLPSVRPRRGRSILSIVKSSEKPVYHLSLPQGGGVFSASEKQAGGKEEGPMVAFQRGGFGGGLCKWRRIGKGAGFGGGNGGGRLATPNGLEGEVYLAKPASGESSSSPKTLVKPGRKCRRSSNGEGGNFRQE